MKKLYRKGTIHPSPPPPPHPPQSHPPPFADYLAFLPAAILTLAAALSAEDKEVLAYLISCSSSSGGNFPSSVAKTYNQKSAPTKGGSGGGDHTPAFNCSCFRCYMSYWVRWDSSPNRQLIHEIIDAYEDGLLSTKKKNNKAGGSGNRNKGKKDRKKKGLNGSDEPAGSGAISEMGFSQNEMGDSPPRRAETTGGEMGTREDGSGGVDEEACEEEEEAGEKGSVRKLVSFIGERIWGVWG